jgi:hypothetical protein
LKRISLFVFAALFGLTQLGCQEDLNKNVPKSLPPGAKPFQTTDRGMGGGDAPSQKVEERAK